MLLQRKKKMDVQFTTHGAVIHTDDSFNLTNTFECGQCFRWEKISNSTYSGIVFGKEVTLSQQNGCFLLSPCTPQELDDCWRTYFDLDTDYRPIRQTLSAVSPALRSAVESIDGIRILRQDPWEALCSFILSQNNNIPRIKGIICRLCETFGEKCGSGYTFPSADILAKENAETLSPLRAGFRTKYILDAAQKISSGEVDLSSLYTAPMDECRKELMKIKGVGAKVAECTLLYGLHRLEAFPVDVWMKKALACEFAGCTPELFGEYAGIAQQYIFHYIRTRPHPSE